jgi:hypothetical protein
MLELFQSVSTSTKMGVRGMIVSKYGGIDRGCGSKLPMLFVCQCFGLLAGISCWPCPADFHPFSRAAIEKIW